MEQALFQLIMMLLGALLAALGAMALSILKSLQTELTRVRERLHKLESKEAALVAHVNFQHDMLNALSHLTRRIETWEARAEAHATSKG